MCQFAVFIPLILRPLYTCARMPSTTQYSEYICLTRMVIGFSNIPSNKSNKIFFQPIINDIPRIIRVNKDSAEGSIQRTTKRTMRNDW